MKWTKEYQHRWIKSWYRRNRRARLRKNKEYYRKNKKAILAWQAEYSKRPEVKLRAVAYHRKWRKKHPIKVKAAWFRNKYGVELTTIWKMRRKQKGRCAICKKKKRLNLDHNHKTGAVRGLLCINCNTMLGSVKETPSVLIAGAQYIKSYQEKEKS